MIYRIINFVDHSKARFSPRLIYWIFITCDLISLALQSAGGGLSSDASGSSYAGVPVALAGLAFQVVTLAIFILVCADYAFRSRETWMKTRPPTSFKLFVGFLTLATFTIFIRCCFRVDELGSGYSRQSKVLRNESLFIGLESVMIVVAAFALIGAHPGLTFNKHGIEGSLGEKTIVGDTEAKEIDGSTVSE